MYRVTQFAEAQARKAVWKKSQETDHRDFSVEHALKIQKRFSKHLVNP
jgi:hypothetical protein